jgi:4-amino-4-deoxy-L-arabinose transferase-like glycosyltransferase
MALAEHEQPMGQFNPSGEVRADSVVNAVSPPAINWRALLWTGAALLFAAVAQFYFANRRDVMWDGVIFYAIAVVCFVLALRRLRPAEAYGPAALTAATTVPAIAPVAAPEIAAPPAVIRIETAPRPALRDLLANLTRASQRRPALIIAAVSIVSGLLAASLANRLDAESYAVPTFLWAIGWLGFTSVFALDAPLPTRAEALSRLRAWAALHRLELITVGGIMLLALLVRLLSLDMIPTALGGDEGTQGVWALDALTGKLKNPFITGWYDMPTMHFFIVSIFLRFFPIGSVAALRLPYMLLALLSVLWTYLLVRDLWGNRWLAVLAAFALATAHYHIHFSRLGSAQIVDTFFVTLVLWLYIRAERSGSLLTYALCGLALGFSNFFYYGARIIGIILAMFVLYRAVSGLVSAIRARRLTDESRATALRSVAGLIVMGITAGLVVAPLGLFWINHPATLTSRANAVGIYPSGWMDLALATTGMTEWQLIGEQIRKSLSAFNFTPDPTFWYYPQRPLLDAVSGVLFVFGLAYSVAKLRQRPYWLLVAWFFLSVTFGWIMTENPPSSMRMLVVTPAVAILVALGLQQVFRLVRHTAGAVAWLALPLVLFAIAFLNLNFYFREYTPDNEYGFVLSQVSTPLARTLQQRTDDYKAYVFNAGASYMVLWNGNGVFNYMLYGKEGVDVTEPLTGPPTFVDPARSAVFVFMNPQSSDIQYVQQAYPQGRLQIMTAPSGRYPFAVYEVNWQ